MLKTLYSELLNIVIISKSWPSLSSLCLNKEQAHPSPSMLKNILPSKYLIINIHTIIRVEFVCVFPYLLRGPLTDLRQTWWVYVGGPWNCPWGYLFRKGQRVDGSTGHFRFPLYYIGTTLTPHSCNRRLLLGKQQSLIRRLLLWCMSTTYVGGPGNCYWGVLFLKRQRVNGSNRSMGQWVTFTFIILYMIADDARLTPPRCKKHTGSTGWRVNGSTGPMGHFHFHYIIYDSRRRQAHATQLQKAHGVWWHKAHATHLQKAHSFFCSLDG